MHNTEPPNDSQLWEVQWNGGHVTRYRSRAAAETAVRIADGRGGPTTLRPVTEPPFDSRWIRPGPPSIEPGRSPGGVVVRVYATSDPPTLVIEQALRLGDDIDEAATLAAALSDASGWHACLVAYDGDTGERMAWP